MGKLVLTVLIPRGPFAGTRKWQNLGPVAYKALRRFALDNGFTVL